MISNKLQYKISNELYKKIIYKYKKELKSYKKELEELNKIDFKYNKKFVSIDDLVETITSLENGEIEEKRQNNIILYYGNPIVTIQVLFETIRCGNISDIYIENQCYAVNKLLVELFCQILEEEKIKNIVTLDLLKTKQVEEKAKLVDNVIFIGDRNLYNLLNNKLTNAQYIPYDCLDIFVLDEEYEDFAREILNVAMENDIETEIFEEMPIKQAEEYFNKFGNKYMILILAKNIEEAQKLSKELNYKYVVINENPFKKKVDNIFIFDT